MINDIMNCKNGCDDITAVVCFIEYNDEENLIPGGGWYDCFQKNEDDKVEVSGLC